MLHARRRAKLTIRQGQEWPDYNGTEMTVSRSTWKSVVNRPKTQASRNSAPAIPPLATILDEYRMSMHNPKSGVIFHLAYTPKISAT